MATISMEDDAPPIVRILATTLRRAVEQPDLRSKLEGLKGSVALKSSNDPQAATIRFRGGEAMVVTGVDADADVVITIDLTTMGQPNAPKPKVKGAAAHVRLALAVSKLLDPPVIGGWQGAVDQFWTWSQGRRGRPQWLRVVCTDDGAERVLGEPGGTTVEIHGPAWALIGVFTGGDHLGQAILEGRVQGVAAFPVLSEMTGLMTRLMLGEG